MLTSIYKHPHLVVRVHDIGSLRRKIIRGRYIFVDPLPLFKDRDGFQKVWVDGANQADFFFAQNVYVYNPLHIRE